MKVGVNVKDKSEGHNLNEAMRDQAARALMNVVGALMPLTDRERKRVLAFVESSFADDDGPSRPGPVASNRELVHAS